MFLPYIEGVAPGARVLDCAAGTGPLAVGLAQRGFDVTATDASAGMVDRTRALAAANGAASTCASASGRTSATQGFEPFDVVFCVGNSLAHAPRARRAPGRAAGDGGRACAPARCSS